MTVYYNEHDSFAAQWLRNLIAAGHIAPGEVDERSIEDVTPADLRGFTQCHFFAGVGVWSYALRRAGVADDEPIWTGSCPCQPFSTAGKGNGFADERHLWPAFHHLIEQRRPTVVLGEQVASRDAEPWLDLVQDDLEAMGYAFGAVPFPAASVGAPHIRDRLYWVADTDDTRSQGRGGMPERAVECATGAGGVAGGMADTANSAGQPCESRATIGGFPAGNGRGEECSATRPTNGHWRDADWLFCRDGKWRPAQPGTFPLANGATSRVGRLRAYGNAIVAPQAEAFIRAYLGVGA